MKKKIIAIIALCLMVCVLCTATACTLNTQSTFKSLIGMDEEPAPEKDEYYLTDDPMYNQDVLTMSKVTPAKNTSPDEFGLYIFDPITHELIHAEEETTQFDNNKPIVIFTHGMGSSGVFGDDELCLYAAGYNVLIFRWAEYADGSAGDTPRIQSNIWGVNEDLAFYRSDITGQMVYDDHPSHGMAWQYASSFNDFMKAHPDFSGKEIHMYGHSFGGMLTCATLGCMIWGVKTKNYSREYLPDKVMMCDPYVSIMNDDTIVDWTGKSMPDGSIGMGIQIVEEAKAEGIAVAMIRSSPWVLFLASFWGSDESHKAQDQAKYEEMYPEYIGMLAHIDYETAFLEKQLGMFDGINERHCISEEYYEQSFSYPDYIYDGSDPTGESYGINYNTPAAYWFARMGTAYYQTFGDGDNATEYDRSDDVQVSLNIESTKIAGFAFYDENDNGINDDRVYNRVAGVTATLYKDGEKVAEMTTARNGYYEFVIDDITATYQVEITAPDGMTISTKSDKDEDQMNVNAFAKSNRSGDLTFRNTYDLKILNVGIVK